MAISCAWISSGLVLLTAKVSQPRVLDDAIRTRLRAVAHCSGVAQRAFAHAVVRHTWVDARSDNYFCVEVGLFLFPACIYSGYKTNNERR